MITKGQLENDSELQKAIQDVASEEGMSVEEVQKIFSDFVLEQTKKARKTRDKKAVKKKRKASKQARKKNR